MSSIISPADALAGIPGWGGKSATWRELADGLTNRTYLVERGDQAYVLRLDSKHTAAFKLDRVCELTILGQAAARGLAPSLIFADADAGILLSTYIPGGTWRAADLENSERLEALVELLRRVHALPTCGTTFDAKRIARRYVDNLSSHHGLHAFGITCHKIIAGHTPTGVLSCCHNDLVAENIIAFPQPILIDWEYASDNDPLFDLASLIGYHNLSKDTAQELLSAYAGGTNPVLSERLEAQIRLYDAIQWLWLANRHMITSTSAQAARLEDLQQRIR